MSGVTSHGPATLYDSSGHQLISLLLGGSSYALGVAILDASGNQITTFGSSSISGSITISSGTVTLSSNPTVIVSSAVTVTPSSNVTTQDYPATTGAQTSVAANSSATTILASNANRLGASVYNDSSQILYLLASAGTPSTTSYTVAMAANSYYETPFHYTGAITGVWASSSGSARVTQYTS